MNERPDQYYIPDNLNSRRKFFGIPNRNLIETAIVEFTGILIVRQLDFSITMLVIAIMLMLGLGIFLVMGIHHESVTEFFITRAKFKARKAKYHLRKVTDDEKINEDEERENEKVIGENLFDFFRREEERKGKEN